VRRRVGGGATRTAGAGGGFGQLARERLRGRGSAGGEEQRGEPGDRAPDLRPHGVSLRGAGGADAAPRGACSRCQSAPLENARQPKRTQRTSEAAIQSAHASIATRYTKSGSDKTRGRGSSAPLRSWYQRSIPALEPLPAICMSG